MSNYDQALKVCIQNLHFNKPLQYYNQAMSDTKDSVMLPKIHIRFNIALTKENSGELNKAEEEYKQILEDVSIIN